MNNKNKILVGCLALLLVLSVGYALFSETITINGTATAKGDFNITANCQTGVSSEASAAFSKYGNIEEYIPEGGYGESSCMISGDTISMETELKYPTAQRAFTISFKNDGTMDAFLAKAGDGSIYNQSITIYDSNNEVYKDLKAGNSEFSTYLKQFGQFNRRPIAIIKTADGSILFEHETDWQARIYEKEGRTSSNDFYLKLEPGDTLLILAWAYWDEDATMNGYSAKTTAITIGAFEQMTSDMRANPNGSTCFSGC